jgi:integrase
MLPESDGTFWMPNLTKRVLDAAKPEKTEYFLWCASTAGFGVRVYASGRKIFVVQLRVGARQQTQRHKIGAYGPFTVEQARERAERLIRAVADGRDPRREEHDAKAALTVAELCDEYMRAAAAGLVLTRFGQPKSKTTITFDDGRISRHIKPVLGSLKARSVSPADVQRMVDDIAAGKTAGVFKGKPRGKAVVAGGAGTAARVAGLLGGIYTWARRRELVTGLNPAHGIEKASTKTKDRVLSPAELKRLGAALIEVEVLKPAAAAALRLIALTGLRRSEATGLRWTEVDELSHTLRLERSKTGRSSRVVGRSAFDVIRSRKGKLERFLFPDKSGKRGADLKKNFSAIFDAAGLHDARAHDLRRTFGSVAADEGYSDATIGELLGHARRGVTARHYIRRPDAALIAAANRVSSHIAALLDGKERGVVVHLNAADALADSTQQTRAKRG